MEQAKTLSAPEKQDAEKQGTAKPASDKERRGNLGRGLAALFGDSGPSAPQPAGEKEPHRTTRGVPLEHIHPNPNQPRRRFEEEPINQLAQSIRENGLLQPILVRPHPDKAGEFEIVAGERRWRAAQKAQLHEAPVVVRDLSDVKTLEIALLENIQREDLNPIEEADGYRRLMEEFSYTQENLSQALGKGRSQIANALRLLTLPFEVKELVIEGQLTAGHARALVVARDPAKLAQQVVSEGLSVRQIESLAQQKRSQNAGAGGRKKTVTLRQTNKDDLAKDADTLALERDLSEVLGLKVSIDYRGGPSEKGSLTIQYDDFDQLDDVIRRLNQNPMD